MINEPDERAWESTFERLVQEEKDGILDYLVTNKDHIVQKNHMSMPASRMEIVADQYSKQATDISRIIQKIKVYHDEIKAVELQFFKIP